MDMKNTEATKGTEMTDSKATKNFWNTIRREDRIADLKGNGKCATVYTSRDGGSELVCTEAKGHPDSHYSDGRCPSRKQQRASASRPTRCARPSLEARSGPRSSGATGSSPPQKSSGIVQSIEGAHDE